MVSAEICPSVSPVTIVGDGAVLTENSDQLSMEPGVGIHEGLVWCDNPKLSSLPAHPMT